MCGHTLTLTLEMTTGFLLASGEGVLGQGGSRSLGCRRGKYGPLSTSLSSSHSWTMMKWEAERVELYKWRKRQAQERGPSLKVQWAGRQSDGHHDAQRPPPPCSPHRTLVSPGQGPPKGTWPPPTRSPSSALLWEPSADGQKRPTKIYREGKIQMRGV